MRASFSALTIVTLVSLLSCTPKKTEDEPEPSGVDSGTKNEGGKGSVDKDGGDLSPTSGKKVEVSGVVLDVLGTRVAGADVKLGLRSVKSGESGDFAFGSIPVSDEETLVVSHDGFAEGRVTFKPLPGAPSHVKVTLQAAEMVMLEDPSQGGELKTASGAVLSLPANAVVDMDGNPVSGPVQVSVALINDRDEMAAAPPMVATAPGAAQSDAPSELESFGMVSVDLTANGRPVQLASGAAVEIAFPMAAGSHFSAGEAVALWHFDETEQLWKSDGDGMVDANNVFHATVSHFSWWNADQVLTKTCVRSRVFDAQGHPVAGATVNSEGRSYLGSTHAATDMNGNFCIEARVASVIELNTLVRVGDQDQALAVRVNTARTPATCGTPSDCYELPAPLVAVANMPLCQPSQCPQGSDPNKPACCVTDIGPCDFVVHGDCGGSEDGAWDVPSETPGVMQIPGVPMMTLPETDAGLDSGEPLPDAGTDAGIDASTGSDGSVQTDGGDAATACGPFFGSPCQTCLANNCGVQTAACMGEQWTQGHFEGACVAFGQCLCDSADANPDGCEPKMQTQGCQSCLSLVDACITTSCNALCGGGGGEQPDAGPYEPVDHCDAVQALPNLNPVEGTTVGSALANDWYDDGYCQHILPTRGYLPGRERSYSVAVPAGQTLRAGVTGVGMVVMIATDCHDLDLTCVSAGVTASATNETQSAQTVIVTVDNTGVDVEGPFTLRLSTATPSCGDFFRDGEGEGNSGGHESCDDGNTTGGDGCDAQCQIEEDWSCPGDAACHHVVCGDGILDNGPFSRTNEDCDDGNGASGDGCSEQCFTENNYVCEHAGQPCRHVVCGDGKVDMTHGYESCDDSNAVSGDGCSSNCQIEPGWTCDKAGACIQTVCGDGRVGNPETCDDKNTTSGDGCNSNCQRENGWFCGTPGMPCRPVLCGDNIVDWDFESCEDGNTTAGDGCSPSCVAEPGFLCDSAGRNCTSRAAGDLCNNADALPGGTFTDTYTLTGMSVDQQDCGWCSVTRWFSVVQQPGEVTAVRVAADFAGEMSFFTAGCPSRNGWGWSEGGGSFDTEHPTVRTNFNDQDTARTIYIQVGGASASGDFELLVKTGPRSCGDGEQRPYDPHVMGQSEQCDDLNTVDGDGCSASCELEPGYHCNQPGEPCAPIVCGDGFMDSSQYDDSAEVPALQEQCDDGNTTPGDGCSPSCQVEPGAVCEWGSPSECKLTQAGDECSNAIALPLGDSTHDLTDFLPPGANCSHFCGPDSDKWFVHVLQPREVLDVSVSAPFSGMISLFRALPGNCAASQSIGSGSHYFNEGNAASLHTENEGNTPLTVLLAIGGYDDGDLGTAALHVSAGVPTEDCSGSSCVPIVCGDGQRTGNEQCDDGNTTAGDGCSPDCVREAGYQCDGSEPSQCSMQTAGSSCEAAQALAAGDYDFADYEQAGFTRWFQVTVPGGQALALWFITADISNGAVQVVPSSAGGCDSLYGGGPTQVIYYSTVHSGFGGWVNRGTDPATVLLGVQAAQPSAHVTIAYHVGPRGCGDSLTEAPVEQCDDGNTTSGDGCSATCTREVGWDCAAGACNAIICGDGLQSSTEGCDDGNTTPGDGCTATCTLEDGYLCGGVPASCHLLQPGDRCQTALALVDDTYSLADYVPELDCRNCGSGPGRWFEISVPPADTLRVTATTSNIESGWLRLYEDHVACLYPNEVGSLPLGPESDQHSLFFTNHGPQPQLIKVLVTDQDDPSEGTFTLSHSIQPSGCGDSLPNTFDAANQEQCDDGNTQSGDGCSSTCHIELGFACFGEPSECVVPLAGDVCASAEPLAEGNYSLDGYLRENMGGGPDRWFTTSVPAHNLVNLQITSDSTSSQAQLWSRNMTDCSDLHQEIGTWFSPDEPRRLTWYNDSDSAVTLVLELVDQSWHSSSSAHFEVIYSIGVASCGDGFIDWSGSYGAQEHCDDGNTVDDDGCSASCEQEFGYTCNNEPSVCTTQCGDHQVANNEGCDDGNGAAGDGCSPTCTVETGYTCTGDHSACQPTCGDGLVLGGEACDDGNTTNDDGCGQYCQTEYGWDCSGSPTVCTPVCGDGYMVGSESCDDGNVVNGDGCSATCQTTCGDGLRLGVEQCDDGNVVNGDGCSATCQTTCGDGILAGNEQCDDGNTANDDGCSGLCEADNGYNCSGTPSVCVTTCGDGITAGTETCDDGNTANSDGCSATCQTEP